MRLLLAPLNWGLGHATRCVPLIRYLIEQGYELVVASDGVALAYLKAYFPSLDIREAPTLNLRYAKGISQVGAVIRQLPKLCYHAYKDHVWLKSILQDEHFDGVISDNRFGMWSSKTKSIYISHQLMVKMPEPFKWMEGWVHRVHKWVIDHYDECLIPDWDSSPGLSGDLSHQYPLPRNARFIGPLSRFMNMTLPEPNNTYDEVVVLSGLEPQRTMLERQLLQEYAASARKVLLLEGRPSQTPLFSSTKNVHVHPHMSDEQLLPFLMGAKRIVCRSGYSSVMDLAVLGLLDKAYLIPTPGQTEQEYLATLHAEKTIPE